MGLDLYAKIEPLLGFEAEVEELHRLYVEQLKAKGATRVLDIGCGSGALMELLEAEGISVEGIDLSESMVARAKAKGLNATHIDLCEVTAHYDAAVAVFDVLNYLDSEALQRFLNCVSNVLEPDGYFIADINTKYGFEEVAQGTLVLEEEAMFLAVDAVYEDEALTSHFTLFENEEGCYRKESGSITQYFHPVKRFKKLAALQLIEDGAIMLFSDRPDKRMLIFQKRV